jgi:hypothetical protein
MELNLDRCHCDLSVSDDMLLFGSSKWELHGHAMKKSTLTRWTVLQISCLGALLFVHQYMLFLGNFGD